VERARIAECRTGQLALEALAYYAAADTMVDGTFWEEHEWRFTDVQDGSSSALERDILCAMAKRRRESGLPSTHVSTRRFAVRPSTKAARSRELTVPAAFAGFRLGQPLRIAKPLVGLPLKIDTLSSGAVPTVSLSNSKSGITLVGTWSDGVGVVLATTREAGALDGIRVGDNRDAAIARWGPPAASTGQSAIWLARQWVVSASFDDAGRIARLGISQ
jgi:hypothetical protein